MAVDMTKETLSRGSLSEPIHRWAVWFMTPVGLCETLSEAKDRIKDLDLNPDLTIVPVCVAITADGDYEVVHR